MHYLTATLGAVFIFAAVLVVSFLLNWFLPPGLQNPVEINLGPIHIWGTPSLLIGIPVALLAAVHSFRSTVRRGADDAGKILDSK